MYTLDKKELNRIADAAKIYKGLDLRKSKWELIKKAVVATAVLVVSMRRSGVNSIEWKHSVADDKITEATSLPNTKRASCGRASFSFAQKLRGCCRLRWVGDESAGLRIIVNLQASRAAVYLLLSFFTPIITGHLVLAVIRLE